ncbi:tRNA (adenosine(37)-N6)-threonylcarbamoyltransferase complex transferase subunit TsaD [Candidatus Curtissbacteria bacterium]|nr:tRNA (adenosine(37)-N6)-threonylcarbamoyltransferase complex transferase subunit TsaD [Candidatus Curtissbacteria bacterium]
MIILGIETTCDETGVGIVEDGRKVLSNVVSSSVQLHKKYGGIVPEVAAREQIKLIVPVTLAALRLARCKFSLIDAVAVSFGPGLVGSLLIGVEAAKTLSLALDKPLFIINHLVGHVYANWLNSYQIPETGRPKFPLVALIVSGGHTDLILMSGHDKYRWLGGTRDDSAGEVFDKVARVLGLGYPGGPEIEKIASNFQIRNPSFDSKLAQGEQSEIRNLKFPRPMISEDNFDFSFAGLKTAVVNLVTRSQLPQTGHSEIAWEFQNAVVDVLVKKTLKAVKKYKVKTVVVGGGVAANNFLRRELMASSSKLGITVFFPQKDLSVDNGAMIAAAAFFEKNSVNPLKLQADPSLHF